MCSSDLPELCRYLGSDEDEDLWDDDEEGLWDDDEEGLWDDDEEEHDHGFSSGDKIIVKDDLTGHGVNIGAKGSIVSIAGSVVVTDFIGSPTMTISEIEPAIEWTDEQEARYHEIEEMITVLGSPDALPDDIKQEYEELSNPELAQEKAMKEELHMLIELVNTIGEDNLPPTIKEKLEQLREKYGEVNDEASDKGTEGQVSPDRGDGPGIV